MLSRRQVFLSAAALAALPLPGNASTTSEEQFDENTFLLSLACRQPVVQDARRSFWFFITPRTVRAQQDEMLDKIPSSFRVGDTVHFSVTVPGGAPVAADVFFYSLRLWPAREEYAWFERRMLGLCITGAWLAEPTRWPCTLARHVAMRCGRFHPQRTSDIGAAAYSPYGRYDLSTDTWRYVHRERV
jgi:hypothetical protein